MLAFCSVTCATCVCMSKMWRYLSKCCSEPHVCVVQFPETGQSKLHEQVLPPGLQGAANHDGFCDTAPACNFSFIACKLPGGMPNAACTVLILTWDACCRSAIRTSRRPRRSRHNDGSAFDGGCEMVGCSCAWRPRLPIVRCKGTKWGTFWLPRLFRVLQLLRACQWGLRG